MKRMRNTTLFRNSTAIVLIYIAATPALAQEWTRFRGPNGSGVSKATTVPVKWTEDDYNWSIKLPGIGHSSPVIWGDKLFITSADVDAGKRFLLRINTSDGSHAWAEEFEFQKYRRHNNNSFASNTPAVDEDRVYVLWQSPQSSSLVALDHQGQRLWQHDLGAYKHGQGGGTSPIVYQDKVIVCNDQKQPSFLLAVDRETGEPLWKVPRKGKRACYATPCIFEPQGRPAEIVFSHCFEGICGVDPRTGKQNWTINVFGTFAQRAVGSPVIAGDLIIANSGAKAGGKNVVAVRPTVADKGVKVEEVYRVSRTAPHVPTTLAYGNWLFLWNDDGVVTCIDVKTGKTVWQKRIGGNYFGSPICVNGKLYAVDLEGNVVVMSASGNPEVLARNPLGEPSRATPAVSGGRLYVRTYSKLFSIGG